MIKKIYFIIILFFFLFFFEIYLRTDKPPINQSDKLLGWKLKPNLSYDFNQKNLIGEKYNVHFITNERGSRFYGNLKNSDIKILVLGDSMTNGPYSSNVDAWFSVFAKNIEKKFNKNVYVESIGSGGYGTFQQYLLTKKIKKYIKPDFIILQFCDNDFYNNTFEWEKKGLARNQFNRRPYLIDNKIFYHDSYLSYFYNSSLYENLRILNRFDWFLSLSQSLINNFFNIERGLRDKSNNQELLDLKKKSILVTDVLFSKLRNLFPEKKIYIFNMCNSKLTEKFPFNSWKDLSEKNNFITLDFMKNISFIRENYYKDTAHFNATGNKIIGNELFKYIIKIRGFKINKDM